eukprot:6323031-Alexandrium_andersonii.AAC.1
MFADAFGNVGDDGIDDGGATPQPDMPDVPDDSEALQPPPQAVPALPNSSSSSSSSSGSSGSSGSDVDAVDSLDSGSGSTPPSSVASAGSDSEDGDADGDVTAQQQPEAKRAKRMATTRARSMQSFKWGSWNFRFKRRSCRGTVGADESKSGTYEVECPIHTIPGVVRCTKTRTFHSKTSEVRTIRWLKHWCNHGCHFDGHEKYGHQRVEKDENYPSITGDILN